MKGPVEVRKQHYDLFFFRMPGSEESDYYDGTGYCMAFIKNPDKKRSLFRFQTKSRETNALLFYIENKVGIFLNVYW